MFRSGCITGLLLCAVSLRANTPADSAHGVAPSDSAPPPAVYRWTADSDLVFCPEPLETPAQCWRSSHQRASMETGVPGARTFGLSLTTMDIDPVEPFFQPAARYSPYGLGGQLPFEALREGRDIREEWQPMLPLDTPVTSLHWSRGALQMNQFSLDLRRMVGNRAYLGLQYHSDRSDSQAYEYSFNVHQPYLSGWGLGSLYAPMDRDSASLVIQDTSNAVAATQFRPRLGFWLDSQTVLEAYADRFGNSSSLSNPSNPAAGDSAQRLYPAEFAAWTFGAIVGHAGDIHQWRAGFSHSSWDRKLNPKGVNGGFFTERGQGLLDRIRLDWTPRRFGNPELELDLENAVVKKSWWTNGARGATPSSEAWADRESFALGIRPGFGKLAVPIRLEAARRGLPDDHAEWLGGATGDLILPLSERFEAKAGGGWMREGAPEDFLYRWQPALGFQPNPDLKPRSDRSLDAGLTWKSRHVEIGLAWDRHAFAQSWLPHFLPEPDFCFGADSVRYPKDRGTFCVDSVHIADSALVLNNWDEEVRDLYHLFLSLSLGHWKLSLHNTYLNPATSTVQDDRFIEKGTNWQIPGRVYQGQLSWRRKLLRDKLGVETRWDWEWVSKRYVFASDLDGLARLQSLDEYLALDFTARMDVKSFLLYFRAVNLNHDRYATEAGVHPPGVNFRFGIDWRLKN